MYQHGRFLIFHYLSAAIYNNLIESACSDHWLLQSSARPFNWLLGECYFVTWPENENQWMPTGTPWGQTHHSQQHNTTKIQIQTHNISSSRHTVMHGATPRFSLYVHNPKCFHTFCSSVPEERFTLLISHMTHAYVMWHMLLLGNAWEWFGGNNTILNMLIRRL